MDARLGNTRECNAMRSGYRQNGSVVAAACQEGAPGGSVVCGRVQVLPNRQNIVAKNCGGSACAFTLKDSAGARIIQTRGTL